MPENDVFERVEERRREQEGRTDRFNENLRRAVMSSNGIHKKYDQTRYERKAELRELISKWKREYGNTDVLKDEELNEIFRLVEEYSLMDTTATHTAKIKDGNSKSVSRFKNNISRGYEAEGKKAKKILDKLTGYTKLQDELAWKGNASSKKEREQEIRQLMAENLRILFEEPMKGYLDPVPKGAHHIKGWTPKLGAKDERDFPLFPHDPSPNDIVQSRIGDCYLIAVLSSIASTNPDKIREMMRDNGNGTVTVRLYQRINPIEQPEENRKNHDIMKPFYVTVPKEISKYHSAQRSLWVSILEQAVAVSGIRLDKGREYYARPVPQNVHVLYERYKNLPEYMRPTHKECPWLFDTNDHLKQWKPEAHQIETGFSGAMASAFLGEKYAYTLYKNQSMINQEAAQFAENVIIDMIGQKTSKEFAEKFRTALEKVDSRSEKRYCLSRMLTAVDRDQLDWENFEIKVENDTIVGPELKTYEYFYTDVENALEKAYRDTRLKSSITGDTRKIFVDSLKNALGQHKIESQTEKKKRAFLKNSGPYTEVQKKFGEDHFAEYAQKFTELADGLFSKMYSQEYEEKFSSIEKSLAEGHIITCATYGSTDVMYKTNKDQKVDGGLNYRHAYSVIGVAEEKHNGKNYKYVIIRNPHGGNITMDYDYSKIPPQARTVRKSDSEGISKIELNHFMGTMSHFNINGAVSLEKSPTTKYFMDPAISHRYERLLNTMKNDMKILEKNVQTQTLMNKFDLLCSVVTKFPYTKQKQEDITDYIRETERYLSGHVGGEIAEKGMIEASAKIAQMFLDGVKNPQKEISDKISGFFLQREKPLYKIIEMGEQCELDKGVDYDLEETHAMNRIFKRAESSVVASSDLFVAFGNKMAELNNTVRTFSSNRTGENMQEYIRKLKELGDAAKSYLDYKVEQRKQPNGTIKVKSKLERTRIDAANQISYYALHKCKNLQKAYTEMLLAKKILGEASVESNQVKQTVTSKAFRNVSFGKSLKELEEILQNEKDFNEFGEKYAAEVAKNDNRPAYEKYIDEKSREYALLIKKPDSTKVEKERAAATLLYGVYLRMSENKGSYRAIRDSEKEIVDYIVTDEQFKNFMETQPLDENLYSVLDSENIHNKVVATTAAMMIANTGKGVESIIHENEVKYQQQEVKEKKLEEDIEKFDNPLEDEMVYE